MSTYRVDPVHFFDNYGRSELTNAYLLKRVAELEANVERLKDLLESQVRRNQLLSAELDQEDAKR